MTILRTEDSLKVIRKLSDWLEYIDAPYTYGGGVLEAFWSGRYYGSEWLEDTD